MMMLDDDKSKLYLPGGKNMKKYTDNFWVTYSF